MERNMKKWILVSNKKQNIKEINKIKNKNKFERHLCLFGQRKPSSIIETMYWI